MQNYKVAVVGCGRIFYVHAVSIKRTPGVTLVAVCDVKEDRAVKNAEEFSCKAYTDYKEMIEKEKPDVVHICLPHYLHAPVAIYCLERGVHVLTEKPMAIKLEDARAMIDTAKKHNTRLDCIFQNRFNPGVILIKEQLESGALGEIKSAKCSLYWRRTDEYYQTSDWKGTWDKEGGGVVIDQAIHTLDLMRYFMNSEIDYIDAHWSRRGHTVIEVEDCAEGAIMFKNGVITSFHVMNYYAYDSAIQVDVACTEARARLVNDSATIKFKDGRELIANRNPKETFNYGANAQSYWGVSHEKQILDFYETLRSGARPYVEVEEAYKTQEMVCAIYQSGREGKRIYLK